MQTDEATGPMVWQSVFEVHNHEYRPTHNCSDHETQTDKIVSNVFGPVVNKQKQVYKECSLEIASKLEIQGI